MSKSHQPSDAGDGSVEGAAAAELVHEAAPQEHSNVCASARPPSTGSDSAASSQRGIGIWLFKRALRRGSGAMSARTDNEKMGKSEELSPSISTLRVVGETCK